jgi:fatty-acyl-CoA synthase
MDISFFTRQPFQDISRFGPDRPALSIDNNSPLTFRDIAEGTNRYAHSLITLGVKSGDRVGILLYNSVEYWLAYFAITRIGAIAVRLNFRLGPNELQHALDDSGSTVLLVDAELLDRVEPLRANVRVQHYICHSSSSAEIPNWAMPWSVLSDGEPSEIDLPLPTDTTPAMLMYTSGTTGKPKGALWTHGNTTWWTAMQILEWGFAQDSVTMVTGPLYHIGGLENYSLPTLAVGGRVVILRSTGFNLIRTLRIASDQGVTDLLLFPTMIYQLLELENIDDIDLNKVQRIFTGGDAVTPLAVQRMAALFPWIDLVQLYGLTEGTPIVACGGRGFAREHPESVGRAFPFSEVSIRDSEGTILKPGERGEIWTRSPANTIGYWNNPTATAATFVDGWCKTGDAGIVEGGYLRLAGRMKDMIRSGGENIYPGEIENALLLNPKIIDAAVIGLPDAYLVEMVCTVVVLAAGQTMTEEEVVKQVTDHLASYKKPRRVVFVDELPRTPSMKIMKYLLREQLNTTEAPGV